MYYKEPKIMSFEINKHRKKHIAKNQLKSQFKFNEL